MDTNKKGLIMRDSPKGKNHKNVFFNGIFLGNLSHGELRMMIQRIDSAINIGL